MNDIVVLALGVLFGWVTGLLLGIFITKNFEVTPVVVCDHKPCKALTLMKGGKA